MRHYDNNGLKQLTSPARISFSISPPLCYWNSPIHFWVLTKVGAELQTVGYAYMVLSYFCGQLIACQRADTWNGFQDYSYAHLASLPSTGTSWHKGRGPTVTWLHPGQQPAWSHGGGGTTGCEMHWSRSCAVENSSKFQSSYKKDTWKGSPRLNSNLEYMHAFPRTSCGAGRTRSEDNNHHQLVNLEDWINSPFSHKKETQDCCHIRR